MSKLSGKVLMFVGGIFLVACFGAVILGILGAIRASYTSPNGSSKNRHGLQSNSNVQPASATVLSDDQRAIAAVKSYRPASGGATVGKAIETLSRTYTPEGGSHGWRARVETDGELWNVTWHGANRAGLTRGGNWWVRLSEPGRVMEGDDSAREVDKIASKEARMLPAAK